MRQGREGADRESSIGLALALSGLYRLLARVFSAVPTKELLGGIKESRMVESLVSLGIVLDEGFLAGDAGEQAEELAVEYTRLFVGPGTHIAPYESVFLQDPAEEQPRLWGRAAVAVDEFYRRAGLELKTGSEMPDHIGIEFEAMAELAAAEAEAREKGQTAEGERLLGLQDEFLKEHLSRWAGDFHRAVERQGGSGFYRVMSGLAVKLVEAREDDMEE